MTLASSILPANATRVIRVLIVDDSAVVRQILTRALASDPLIQVIGTAADPYIARDKIIRLTPDVVTLDIDMPRMDGITFLRKLMAHHPLPVIVVSSLTAQGTDTAIEALAAGAVDVVGKPDSASSVDALSAVLIEKIKDAAKARLSQSAPLKTSLPYAASAKPTGAEILFAFGASTGGVQAITEVLTRFPANCPGTLVVQHMPAAFTASFAARLHTLCQSHGGPEIKEAADGDSIMPGRVLIAPGGRHMLLRRISGSYQVQVKDGPAVFHQKPSVDVLLESVARAAGPNAVAAILTGMGTDGARGLRAMRNAGARTLAQDELSSVVYGMPAEALKCGAAEQSVPLADIAHTMLQLAQKM